MVTTTGGYSGLSVRDIPRAVGFYRDVLGLEVTENPNGAGLALPGGTTVFLYPKDDHRPASYTAIYLEVPDIAVAVRELTAAGVALERYPGMPQDDDGVMRGKDVGRGPNIAWFLDPDDNIVAIVED